VTPSLVVGLEDWYGQTGVGWSYLPQNSGFRWELFNPLANLDTFAFVPAKYQAVRPIIP